MDTFVEQIIVIKKTSKTWLGYAGITLTALILMTVAYMFLYAIFIPLDFLIFWGAYKLYTMLNIEYEYIITNSTMDIDKIIAKSSRKRMISFDLSTVLRIEKYTGSLPQNITKDCFFACNIDDENAYIVYYKKDGNPQKTFVFAPSEKTISAMKDFLPRHIVEVFK